MMADYDFTIPLNLEDLQRRTSPNQYVVDEVMSVWNFQGQLHECRTRLRMQGPDLIAAKFDCLYSVLKHFHEVQPEIKEELYKVLTKATNALADELEELLTNNLDPVRRKEKLNLVKMTVYLLCKTMELFEAGKPVAVPTAGKSRKKAASVAKNGDVDWEGQKKRGVLALTPLLNLHLHRLWDPPVPEDEFVSLVTNCCYKMLESPNTVKDKETRDAIFHVLGIMIKKYNHGLSCTIKIIQLIQHFEHLAAPLAVAIQTWATQLGVKGLVRDIMREIGQLNPADLTLDTSGTRSYANFLSELSEKVPGLMLPYLDMVMPLLDEEPYTMRNCLLTMLGEIIVQVLCKENMTDELRETRDEILDNLEEHIHDVNAFTRSKSIQIWTNIVKEKRLPLQRQSTLVELVTGRLDDRSCQVRKHSAQIMTLLLHSNQVALKVSMEELVENYEKEKAKLADLQPSHATGLRKEVEEEWSRVKKEVSEAVSHAMFDADGEEREIDVSLVEEADTAESTRERIVQLLKERKYQSALHLLRAACDAFPAEPCFTPQKQNLANALAAAEGMEADSQDEAEDADNDPDKQKKQTVNRLVELLRAIFLGDALIMAAAEIIAAEDPEKLEERKKRESLVIYLKAAVAFRKQVDLAIPVVVDMLASNISTDVLEAIEFLVTCVEYNVPSAKTAVQQMLVLIWSKEASIKEAIVEAYKRLYLKPVESNSKARAMSIVKNLTALMDGATLASMSALDELVCEFVKQGEVDNQIINTLWERFSRKIPDTSDGESRAALLLIGMAAGADVKIVRSNIDVLVKEGLGPRAENDMELTRDVCIVLQKLKVKEKLGVGRSKEPYRFSKDHEMFQRIAHLIVQGVTNKETYHWTPMMEQGINAVYKLAENPDVICGDIFKQIIKIFIDSPDNEIVEGQEKGAAEAKDHIPSYKILTRMISMAGHIALRQLIHMDVDILNELKRRNVLQEEKEVAKSSPSKDKRSKEKDKNEEMDEEMGLAGANADDTEAEFIRELTEHSLVNGTNLLSAVQDLILKVVNNPLQYNDAELQTAATLTLTKYMIVSSEFCEKNLQLLFTLLEKSPHATIRCNTIVALGDLTSRYPNSIEPWTPHLYARLRDHNPQVRCYTLKVLTDLILNDLVKVKGQISDLASCIDDQDEKIQRRTKIFFSQLAKKGNAIYNIMPDMISRLSDAEVGVEEENFRNIMEYLFSFIQKDKHSESLVEKLCHRFRSTNNPRQWRDLSFCLSMLTYNERSVRKLQENFPCYADKLREEEVYASFTSIMTSIKNSAKPEIKTMAEELEPRLEACHRQGVAEEEVADNANKAVAAARTKGKRTPRVRGGRAKVVSPKTKTQGKRRSRETAEDEEESMSDESDFVPPPRSQAGRKAKAKKSMPKLNFSDDDSDLEMFDMNEKKEEGRSKKS